MEVGSNTMLSSPIRHPPPPFVNSVYLLWNLYHFKFYKYLFSVFKKSILTCFWCSSVMLPAPWNSQPCFVSSAFIPPLLLERGKIYGEETHTEESTWVGQGRDKGLASGLLLACSALMGGLLSTLALPHVRHSGLNASWQARAAGQEAPTAAAAPAKPYPPGIASGNAAKITDLTAQPDTGYQETWTKWIRPKAKTKHLGFSSNKNKFHN